MCRSGQVEGIHVEQIVLDTGCSRTMVRCDLVPGHKLIEGDAVTIRCAHSDTVVSSSSAGAPSRWSTSVC